MNDFKYLSLNDFKIEDYKIIDTHIHIGKYTGSFVNSSFEENQNKTIKSLGFEKIIFIHNSFFTDLDLGIKNTLDFLNKNSGFAYAYLVYNPHYIEKSLNLIDAYFGRNKVIGIKIHPEDHQVYITDKRYEKLWKAASEKSIPVLSHTWNPNVAGKFQKYADALLFEEVSDRYPKLKIILGHAAAKDYYYFKVIDKIREKTFLSIYREIFFTGGCWSFLWRSWDRQIYYLEQIPLGSILCLRYFMCWTQKYQ
jgi:hypothetical protein